MKNFKNILVISLFAAFVIGTLGYKQNTTGNYRTISDTINQYATDISKYADPALRPLAISKYNNSQDVEAVIENPIIDAINLKDIDLMEMESNERAEFIAKTMDALIAVDLIETSIALASSEYDAQSLPIDDKFNKLGTEVKNNLLKVSNDIDDAWGETLIGALIAFIGALLLTTVLYRTETD
ncbi:TPA: hypothetical protein I7730_16275 [Vibrio vulnificus]|uniref:Uncharacterized protein n=1 Tax=Vibrio vulnificus TaxID=672 RepID=A0A8H9N1Y4_VIBVL|nr:hypothetical protein [Vibrio vulnificus]HAS8541341.1 hypothetical protein [Vibrio vulnificus]